MAFVGTFEVGKPKYVSLHGPSLFSVIFITDTLMYTRIRRI